VLQSLALIGRPAGRLPRVPFGLAHPPVRGFDRAAQFVGGGPHRRPSGGMLVGVVEDLPDGGFTRFGVLQTRGMVSLL